MKKTNWILFKKTNWILLKKTNWILFKKINWLLSKRKNSILFLSIALNVLFLSFSMFLLPLKGETSYLLSQNPQSQSTSTFKDPIQFPAYYLDRRSLFEVVPKNQNDIVFLGDSLTNRCEWSELFQNPNIKNRGINGDNTYGLLYRLDQITRPHPRKIFIMIGINDLIPREDLEKINYKYSLILKTIKQSTPDTQVYIQSVLPVNNRLKQVVDNKDVIALNDRLKKLAKEFKYEYIDLYSAFVTDNQLTEKYTYDGIHLNGDGYLVWKDAISKYVN